MVHKKNMEDTDQRISFMKRVSVEGDCRSSERTKNFSFNCLLKSNTIEVGTAIVNKQSNFRWSLIVNTRYKSYFCYSLIALTKPIPGIPLIIN